MYSVALCGPVSLLDEFAIGEGPRVETIAVNQAKVSDNTVSTFSIGLHFGRKCPTKRANSLIHLIRTQDTQVRLQDRQVL